MKYMDKNKVAMELDKLLKLVEKPARYIGGEMNSVIKADKDIDCHMGFAFPDTYEIGMSYLGLQILYKAVNDVDNLYCERIFCPALDMEKLMRERNVPIFTIETKTPIRDLDIIGFTLQYEMSYTNILNILNMGGIPLLAADRNEEDPIIIAGGPCAYNPEPLADFMDIFLIGDGELSLPALCNLYGEFKKTGKPKVEFFKQVCNLEGIYVPSFYEPVYNEDGTIKVIRKLYEGAPDRVERYMLPEIESLDFPKANIVPLIEVVHDRAVVETFRGCTRGCRFCQAGMIYRPVRERSMENILNIANKQLEITGHEELSLLSLSTSDHSQFKPLVLELMDMCMANNISLSLPSLRLDNFSFEVLERINRYKRSNLTFAPEAGTQRLRDVINKGITEENIYSSMQQALEQGYSNIKLYFMIGLPTETDEDLDGIAEIAQNIVELNYKIKGRKGGRFNVTVSASNFVPKAHTPFQWVAQDTQESFKRKHMYLRERLHKKGITFNYHDTDTSFLEAVFARGDRRVSKALISAFKRGCKFDGWSEHFKYESWIEALREAEIDTSFYNSRERRYDEILPWDIIDSSISKEFLISENEKAKQALTTHDCRKGCVGCGISKRVNCSMGGVLKYE